MKMKRALIGLCFVLVLLAGISILAQVNRPYRNASVWRIVFIRVKSGMNSTYLNTLANNWKKEREAMKKEGLILSYKVLMTESHSIDDWNLMLMTEFKDLTTMETEQAKRDAIVRQVVGDERQQAQGFNNLTDIREDIGYRIAREIVFTSE